MVNMDSCTGFVDLTYLRSDLYNKPTSAAVSRSVH
jgi:hypothetical protein